MSYLGDKFLTTCFLLVCCLGVFSILACMSHTLLVRTRILEFRVRQREIRRRREAKAGLRPSDEPVTVGGAEDVGPVGGETNKPA